MAENAYVAFRNGTQAGNHPDPAAWFFNPHHPPVYRTVVVPNPQHPGFHAVGGGVTPHAVGGGEMHRLLASKAHLEVEIGGLQQRLGDLNRQIQALNARHGTLDS